MRDGLSDHRQEILRRHDGQVNDTVVGGVHTRGRWRNNAITLLDLKSASRLTHRPCESGFAQKTGRRAAPRWLRRLRPGRSSASVGMEPWPRVDRGRY